MASRLRRFRTWLKARWAKAREQGAATAATRHRHPGRRRGDSLRGWVSEHWKTVVVSIAFFYLLLVVTSQVDENRSRLDRQAEGRRIAVDVLCGLGSGVAKAGSLTFSGELPGIRGKPNPTAQKAYADVIVASVANEAGVEARGLVLSDGSIDCDELSRRANAAARNGPRDTP